ncbi:MAG: Na/Pi cotransporter family protein [Lachnospiraceae bacterium]|nr:Na/Pi cotransporter family protein [Lachnospiraceae bacterium]
MDVVNTLFGLFGGLALFLFGMEMMSDGLQKAAGERMKYILGLLTKNPVMGVLAGALTTAVLQSSSATTVMVIGFVSAGLMNLPQAISIIMGANIGTTITAQIIAFKISDYIYPIVFIGFLTAFVAKREVVKYIGNTIFGFGILFIGIEIMGNTMKPLASSQIFLDLIGKVADIPVLGLLLGVVITVIVQSSSAVIAVLQNFASQAGPDGVSSILGLPGAIPILLGSNIGTTITALLACIGQTRNAKRTAAAHSVFNITGSILFMFIISWFAKLVIWISPAGAEVDVISRQIANAHTVFNVTNTIIWIPLIWLMVKIVMWILPDKREGEEEEARAQFLDVNVMNQPVVALHLVSEEIINYANRLGELLADTKRAMLEGGQENINRAGQMAKRVSHIHEDINNYLIGLFSSGNMNEEQAAHTTEIMYIVEDLERIGRCMKELLENAEEKDRKEFRFSKKAMTEIEESFEIITVMFLESVNLIKYGDKAAVPDVEQHLKRIAKLEKNVRKNHKKRIKEGKCKPEFTNIFANIFHSMEKIGENCSNITESVTEDMYLKYLPEEHSRISVSSSVQ